MLLVILVLFGRRSVAGSLFVLTGACSASLPEPPRGAHRAEDFVEVPYPPPAALVETVPLQPRSGTVWVDGYWDWSRREYLWVRGGWVDPPEAARHARWVSGYTKDGRLLFARSVWFDEKGRPIPDPEIVRPAFTPPNELTGEFQAPR